MKLKDKNGHITQEALLAWNEGSLCEQQRLELAEHLTCCDDCLLRLTALELEELPPARDLVGPAVRQARPRRPLLFWQRCGSAAAAVCFAFLGWRLDLLGQLNDLPQRIGQAGALQQAATQLSQELSGWSGQLSDTLQTAFDKNQN